MIYAYENDLRQPSLTVLIKLLAGAGFELQMHLVPQSEIQEVAAARERARYRRELAEGHGELLAWRHADLEDVLRDAEKSGRPDELSLIPLICDLWRPRRRAPKRRVILGADI